MSDANSFDFKIVLAGANNFVNNFNQRFIC